MNSKNLTVPWQFAPLQPVLDAVYISYTIQDFPNLLISMALRAVFAAILLVFLRPILLWLHDMLLPAKSYTAEEAKKYLFSRVMYKLESVTRSFVTLFDGVHYFWAILMLIITIPYTRMPDSTAWNCYWSWILQAGTTVLLLFDNPKYPKLRQFTVYYWLYLANGVMATANTGYIYYALASYSWPYMFIHFAPPGFIWLYLFLKAHKMPDSLNPLKASYGATLFALIFFADLFQIWYLGTRDVVKVYELEHTGMPYLYVIGNVCPPIANLIALLLITFSKVWYIRIFGHEQVKEQ